WWIGGRKLINKHGAIQDDSAVRKLHSFPLRKVLPLRVVSASLRFFLREFFFDGHVLELAGLEDLATDFAFHVFGVFGARDHAHSRVLTVWRHRWETRRRMSMGERGASAGSRE